MNRTKYGIDFFNVPKAHKYDEVPDELLCEVCNDIIEQPLHVFTCKHHLCAPCWQKSAYNLWGNKNECLKCKTPTELVCYRDFWRFVGRNLFDRNFMIDHGKCVKLECSETYCNIDGCNYKGQRWDVIAHERKCWREHRNLELSIERREAVGAENTRDSKTAGTITITSKRPHTDPVTPSRPGTSPHPQPDPETPPPNPEPEPETPARPQAEPTTPSSCSQQPVQRTLSFQMPTPRKQIRRK